MENTVSIHKDFNRSAIPFYKEIAINFFGEIMKRWNNETEYSKLIYTKTEIKELLKLQSFDYLQDFLLQFVKDTTANFKVEDTVVTGTAFYFVTHLKKEIVEVHLQEELRPYLFTKKDIESMKKNKNGLSMTRDEIDEYNKNKLKYKKLMIFSQTDLLKFSSKYTKRLYMLLIQFKKTGFFVMDYEKFKNVMEIPNSYQQSKIDKRILEFSIEELKKANIFIYKINKNKQGGRAIKVIEISFEYKNEELKKEEKLKLKSNSAIKENLKKTTLIENLEKKNNISVEENARIALENIKKIKENLMKNKLKQEN